MNRRRFLGVAGVGVGAASIGSLTGERKPAPWIASPTEPGGMPPFQEGGDWAAIDADHKAQVDAFLANVGAEPDFWRKPLEFTMSEDGFKVFEITCVNVDWDTGGGQIFPAFAYNGMIPGPEIRVTEGDKVRVVVTNEMSESTSIHWHGIHLPNNMDGVPYVTQDPITPGSTFTYEFEAINTGSHMYHSHHNAAEQVVRGLLGAIIIDPKDTSGEPVVDGDYTLILNDSGLGYTLNGRAFPYTQPIVAKKGHRIRIRYMNEGLMIHPMHLHGIPQLVIAKDGYPLPMPFMCDTLNVAPGERYDVLVDCIYPGYWAFHCHILTHAESRRGMYGMVTVLVVEDDAAAAPAAEATSEPAIEATAEATAAPEASATEETGN